MTRTHAAAWALSIAIVAVILTLARSHHVAELDHGAPIIQQFRFQMRRADKA